MPEPGGSGMTAISMSRVPGGAPLPPCRPLARLRCYPARCYPARCYAGCRERSRLCGATPAELRGADARARCHRGLIQRNCTLKPPPLGVTGGGLSLKPALMALSIALEIACPEICATIGVTESCNSRSLMLSLGKLTVCSNADEVLAALLVSPLYRAVIAWLPTVSAAVVKLAAPPDSVAEPICALPSKKVTVPLGETPVTVAVDRTACPVLEGFCDDDSDVVVPANP